MREIITYKHNGKHIEGQGLISGVMLIKFGTIYARKLLVYYYKEKENDKSCTELWLISMPYYIKEMSYVGIINKFNRERTLSNRFEVIMLSCS